MYFLLEVWWISIAMLVYRTVVAIMASCFLDEAFGCRFPKGIKVHWNIHIYIHMFIYYVHWLIIDVPSLKLTARTWKWTLGKGDWYWKPSFLGAMLVFFGEVILALFENCWHTILEYMDVSPFSRHFDLVQVSRQCLVHTRHADDWNKAFRVGRIRPIDGSTWKGESFSDLYGCFQK